MRLLCIANPEAYSGGLTDIPLSYNRLSAQPAIELYHADTSAMLTDKPLIEAQHIEPGFDEKDFDRLPARRTRGFDPAFFDVAFCRTLKPFPQGYLVRLRQWSDRLSFVNDPAGIKHQLQPEFFARAASGYSAPMLLDPDIKAATHFLDSHRTIVAKRGNSCGGRGVYRIGHETDGSIVCDNIIEGERRYPRFELLHRALTRDGRESLLLMPFLHRVIEGDRRIVVVDGQIYGSYLRRSTGAQWVQNVSTGATCTLQQVTAADRDLVAATSVNYSLAGINVLGYDLLRSDDGQWVISEINAGNIGGLFRLETLGITGVSMRFAAWLAAFANRQNKTPATSGPVMT